MNRLFTCLTTTRSIIPFTRHTYPQIRQYAKRTNVRKIEKQHHKPIEKSKSKEQQVEDLDKIISDYEKATKLHKVKFSFDENYKVPQQEEEPVNVDDLAKSLKKPLHTDDSVEEYMKKQKYEAYHMYFASSYKGDLANVDDYLKILREDKAQDIVVIDCRRKCSWTNYMIIVTGASNRHMKVMAKHAVEMLKERKIYGLAPSIEGEECDNWMVVDGGNIVLQVLSPEGRALYDLERKWAFNKIEEYEPMNSIHSAEELDGKTTSTGIVFEKVNGANEPSDSEDE